MSRRRRLAAFALGNVLILAGLAGPPVEAAALPGPSEAAAPFKVGAATASADFEGRLCLGGYGAFCNRPTETIRDPLTTAAFAFTGGDGTSVLLVKTTAVGLFASYKPEQGETGIYDRATADLAGDRAFPPTTSS